jgi:hypothetical protein
VSDGEQIETVPVAPTHGAAYPISAVHEPGGQGPPIESLKGVTTGLLEKADQTVTTSPS